MKNKPTNLEVDMWVLWHPTKKSIWGNLLYGYIGNMPTWPNNEGYEKKKIKIVISE